MLNITWNAAKFFLEEITLQKINFVKGDVRELLIIFLSWHNYLTMLIKNKLKWSLGELKVTEQSFGLPLFQVWISRRIIEKKLCFILWWDKELKKI